MRGFFKFWLHYTARKKKKKEEERKRLTNHLGDSGMKKMPIVCNAHGRAP